MSSANMNALLRDKFAIDFVGDKCAMKEFDKAGAEVDAEVGYKKTISKRRFERQVAHQIEKLHNGKNDHNADNMRARLMMKLHKKKNMRTPFSD